MSRPLTIAILGCGSRGRTYARLISSLPERYRIVAAGDPNPVRLDEVEELSGTEDFQRFDSAQALFDASRLADVLVIATRDNQHHAHALAALNLDYHLLLEKPAGQRLEELVELRALATARRRKVALCFVLRYTPFYRTARELIATGRLGRIMHIEATEGVGAFHQVHSYVRGHWHQAKNSSPMIIAKCCHDTDLLSWLQGGKLARRVSSFGELSWFRAENAPADAPARCTEGCPHLGSCRYDVHRYLSDQRRWLDFIHPGRTGEAGNDELLAWLADSPWGRCAWRCDNDVVDHQVVAVEFEDGTTASLTMSAFERGRQLVVHGTEGTLRGGEDWQDPSGEMRLWFRALDALEAEEVPLPAVRLAGYAEHGGGDFGLIDALDEIFAPDTDATALLDSSLESHLIGFAAEASRLDGGRPVDLASLRQ